MKLKSIQNKYKKTEIGEIPFDWTLKPLENLCQSNGLIRGPFGGSLKRDFFTKRGYKVYEQRNAIYKSVDIGSYYITEEKYKELERFKVKANDFIVSCSGTIGEIYQIPSKHLNGVINQALLKITINSEVINEIFFLKYFEWDKFKKRIIDNTQGGAMQNMIGMPVFRKILIPVPPKDEQQKIASALSDMDDLIESLEKIIDKKKKIKQGTMQQLLTGEKRLPGFSGKWINSYMEKLAECLDHLRKPLSDSERSGMKGNIPYYGANGIVDYINDYMIDDELILLAEDGGHFEEYLTRPIAYKISGKSWVNNHAHIIKAKEHIYQDYLFYSLVHKNILNHIAGGTRSKLTRAELMKITFYYPKDFKEQQAIAEILSDMDAEIEHLEQRLEKYKELKEGMMQELLTGRIRLV